jgi:predicted RecB family nuclease
MKSGNNSIQLAASDLSNHLHCAHLTTLNYTVATGRIAAPDWSDPDTAVLEQLGIEHERKYLEYLGRCGLKIADMPKQAADETTLAMKQGAEVIAQAVMVSGRWFGRADVLQRVAAPSSLGAWSYEVYDCKLARETKAATILQLSLYSDLLAQVQGTVPRFMHVVSPSEVFTPESFLVTDYAAYYRLVKSRLEQAVDSNLGDDATDPEPNPHCDVCRWWKRCDAEWRRDDHLSLVAGISRLQRKQLGIWDIYTMAQLARSTIQQRPEYGSKEGYVRIGEQAKVQVAGRETRQPVHKVFDNAGLSRLPEPSPGDIFFDLEGDSFVGTEGMEYLFGFVRRGPDSTLLYERRWSFNPSEEKAAFEWFVDSVMQMWAKHFDMHIYHFTAREPSALKRLMGKYGTREDAVDRILRGQLLVDLHRALKQSIRASVEEYKLKALEQFFGFSRGTSLDDARRSRRLVEHSLELGRVGAIDDSSCKTIEGYNCDDCASTEALRSWLEKQRAARIAEGQEISRPQPQDSEPSPALDERQQHVAALFSQLMEDVPVDLAQRTQEQGARGLLANLLDWHRREDRAEGQGYYRLLEMSDEEFLYERAALSGLVHVERISVRGDPPIDRYRFEQQDTNIRADHTLHDRKIRVGKVAAINLSDRTVDIEKTEKTAELHPKAVFSHDDPRRKTACADSLCRLASWVIRNGVDADGPYRCVRDVLLRSRPRIAGWNGGPLLGESEIVTDAAIRIVLSMDSSVLAIQGPPGSGKTFTGAKLICELIRQGKRVGITAVPHRVIRGLFEEVLGLARREKLNNVTCLHKVSKKSKGTLNPNIKETTNNKDVLKALKTGGASVVGGTAFLWSREELFEMIDVLIVDEAAQMSLADVLASGQCAKNLVLLGDPRQLDQPLQGSHPDGADISALGHMLNSAHTIAPDRGLFLPETRRLHPKICSFTSELFYEGRLQPIPGLEQQQIVGHPYLSGAGLCFVSIPHEGNQNASPEEAAVVQALINGLLVPGVRWFNLGLSLPSLAPIARKDILVIAPYNAQVSDISVRLPDIEVGTVDRFQGREAAIVIYSLTTSSPEDAPRGMEFLYSLNRLNVATSRGRALCVVVGSPRLLEPQCRTPRQMQLANALCRFAELARRIEVRDARDGQYEFIALPAA